MAISALVEGSSIRSVERMTGIHRDTIMRLGVRVGEACLKLMDEKMRDMNCEQVQVDELWGFIGKKEKNVSVPRFGKVELQLATLVDDVPTKGQWIYELKYDGYRVQAHIEHGRVTLFTRNGHDWTQRFGRQNGDAVRLKTMG